MFATKKRRERDLIAFLYWLGNEKAVKLGTEVDPQMYSSSSAFLLKRVGTHGWHEERALVAEYVAFNEAPR